MRPLSSALVLLLVLLGAAQALPASASQDASSFQDVPTSHWAYTTLTDLQHHGLISGYPDGYFQGKRALTRYEFAIALKRALDRIPLSVPIEGEPETSVTLHLTADELREMRRLAEEFQGDLSQLGETQKDLEACFAALECAVVRSRPPLSIPIKMPALFPSGGSRGVTFPVPDLTHGYQTTHTPEPPFMLQSQMLRSLPFLSSDAFDLAPAESPGPNLTLPLLGSRFALGEAATDPNAGLRLDVPLFGVGQLGLAWSNMTELTPKDVVPRDVLAYGTDLQLRASGHLTLGAAMTRTLSNPAATLGDVLAITDNDIYRINVGYTSGPANAILGYQLVDPLPDNLSNLQGPYTRLSYRFSNSLHSYLGGDYYTSGHSRSIGTDSVLSSLLSGNIYRGTAGVRWSPARGFSLSADYEGVLYDLSGSLTTIGRRAQPIEQYITLGAGLNLSRNAILKLAYQIANQQDSTGADTSGVSVFTTQFAIHF